jgi:hypothetical protein
MELFAYANENKNVTYETILILEIIIKPTKSWEIFLLIFEYVVLIYPLRKDQKNFFFNFNWKKVRTKTTLYKTPRGTCHHHSPPFRAHRDIQYVCYLHTS